MFGRKRKGNFYDNNSDCIVHITEANGNEVETALGVFVNTKGTAQVVWYGTQKELINSFVNLAAEMIINTVDDKNPEAHAYAVIETIKMAVRRKLGKPTESDKHLEELVGLLNELKDIMKEGE